MSKRNIERHGIKTSLTNRFPVRWTVGRREGPRRILTILSERKNLSAVSITLIVILVIVVIILGAIIGFWIWVRTKSKKYKNGAKQLRAGLGSKVKAQHLSGKTDRI